MDQVRKFQVPKAREGEGTPSPLNRLHTRRAPGRVSPAMRVRTRTLVQGEGFSVLSANSFQVLWHVEALLDKPASSTDAATRLHVVDLKKPMGTPPRPPLRPGTWMHSQHVHFGHVHFLPSPILSPEPIHLANSTALLQLCSPSPPALYEARCHSQIRRRAGSIWGSGGGI